MTMCVVPYCGNRSIRKSAKQIQLEKIKPHPTTYHKFPNNENMCKKWILAINRPNWFPRPSSKVCSDHFKEEFFDRSSPFRVILASNAVPYSRCSANVQEVEEKSNSDSVSEKEDTLSDALAITESDQNIKMGGNKFAKEEGPINDTITANIITTESNTGKSLLMKILKEKTNKNTKTDTCGTTQTNTVQQTYCRICSKLAPISSLTSLYNSPKSLVYLELLDLLLPGLIKVDIRLPTCICKICAVVLDHIGENINTFKKADDELKNMFKVKYEAEVQEEKDEPVYLIVENTPKEPGATIELIPTEKAVTEPVPFLLDEITEINDIEMINFECIHCNKLFPSKNDLLQHSFLIHSVSKFDRISCRMVQTKLADEDPVELPATKVAIIEDTQKEPDDPVEKTSDEEDEPEDSESTQTYCIICCALFDSRTALMSHTVTYHQIIAKDSILNRSITKNLLSKGVINCTRCPESFSSLKVYRQHVLQHLIVKCDQCGKSFTSAHKLNKHHSSTHVIPHSTDEDDVDNVDELNKNAGNVEESSDLESASKRKKDTVDAEVTKTSKNTVMTAKSCLCSTCGKLFPSSAHLAQHRRVHISARNYLCPKCPKAFKTYTHLAKHQYTHSTEPNFCCQICGKTFRSPGGLHKHSYRHKDKKPYYCELCGRGFLFPAQLALHRKRHEKIRKVDTKYGNKCRICNIELHSFNELKSHFTVEHSGLKPYECDECKISFWTKSQFDVHKRVHSGEKPYKCDKCTACFRSSSGLQQHKSVHSDGDFVCSICVKRFKRREHLVLHERTHSGVKMFPCPGCDKVYSQRQTMVKHSQIHDPNFVERADKITNSYKTQAKLLLQIQDDEMGAVNTLEEVVEFEQVSEFEQVTEFEQIIELKPLAKIEVQQIESSQADYIRQSILRMDHGVTINGTPIMELVRYN